MTEYQLFPIAADIQLYAALLLKFFNQALEERLREQGETLSSLQHGILRMLQFQPLTISEISQRLGLDPSTLVRSVDALERKGLAERGSDPHDRRRNPVHLTDRGRALMLAVPIIAPQDATWQALAAVGEETAVQLRDLLRQLVQQFPEGRMVVALSAIPPNSEQYPLGDQDNEQPR
ncbi:MAG: MarR family transcriptional regulator [Chloroflexota bacterium]